MSSSKLSSCTTKKRVSIAQSIKLDWEEACKGEVLRAVSAHADAVGSPKHYIFFPMLTVAASMMGVNAEVRINDEWSEPSILWNVVAARKGEKKTAAMKRLLSSVEVSL
jgi:hypothetical protein